MSSFLKGIGLLKEVELSLDVAGEQLISSMRTNLDRDRFNPLEVFSSSSYKYKGSIKGYSFTIKKKRRLFDSKTSWIRANGTIAEAGPPVKIDLKIRGWNFYVSSIYLFILIYFVFVSMSLLDWFDSYPLSDWLLFLLIVLLHIVLMAAAPVVLLRKAIGSFEKILVRDFRNLAKNGKFS